MLKFAPNIMNPYTQINLDAFCEQLTIEYRELFAKDADYAYAASKTTPEALARKMTLSLDQGTANKDGAGIANKDRAVNN